MPQQPLIRCSHKSTCPSLTLRVSLLSRNLAFHNVSLASLRSLLESSIEVTSIDSADIYNSAEFFSTSPSLLPVTSPHKSRMDEATYEYARHIHKSHSDPYRLPKPARLPREDETSPESSSSGHSHSRTHSWQHSPFNPPSSSASHESISRHFGNSSPSLESSPPSPSPSSISRTSSTSSFATPSRCRPLPAPPTDTPRFVPFRAPPPPPPSLSIQGSAYEEKRELARLRGLDDLLERNEESEREEEEDDLSPTTSDLPEYEAGGHQGSRTSASLGKTALGRLDEDDELVESGERGAEREEMRNRARQESSRLLEEDNRTTKERLLAERRREEEEWRMAREMELEVEEEKRNEELVWRERIESPPPPSLSPTSDMLPLGDSKQRWEVTGRPEEILHLSQSPRSVDYSAPRQLAYPAPPPQTTMSTPIPSLHAHDFAHHRPSQVNLVTRYDYSASTSDPLDRPPRSFYTGLPPRSSYESDHSTLLSSRSTHQASTRRQGSLGPASSFYSSAVGLTVSRSLSKQSLNDI